MGVLVPEGFVLSSLANDAERTVVGAFVSGLSDGWLILPSVGLRIADRDRELDVVLIHETYGIVDIEVKGHLVHIARGQWCRGEYDEPLVPSPPWQAKGNAYALRDHLRTVFPGLNHLEVSWGIAFPNTEAVRGNLPPEVTREQVLTRVDLDDVSEAVEVLASQRYQSQVLTADDISVRVRAGLPVWTDIHSLTGDVRSGLQSLGPPAEGDPYAELRLRTVSGDITIAHLADAPGSDGTHEHPSLHQNR